MDCYKAELTEDGELSMKKRKKWKAVIFLLVLLLAACVLAVAYLFAKARKEHPDVSVHSGERIVYDATEEVEKTFEKYHDSENALRAVKVEGYKASQHKVSLVFCGLSTPAEMTEILDLLDEYEAKAVFICDGMTAAEDPDTVREIVGRGNIVGNYGMRGEPHWEALENEEILTSLAQTQAVMKRITEEAPQYVLANATTVDDRILHLAACAGLDQYISAGKFINDSSFKNFSEALGFVEKTEGGSIICIKIDGNLDEIEFEPYEAADGAAEDKQSTVSANELQIAKPAITETVELLLEALDTTETAVVPLDRLHTEPDVEAARRFEDREDAADYETPVSAKAGEGYFDDTLFIGDSLTLALSYYPVIEDQVEFCAYKSITPMQFVNNTKVEISDNEEAAIWDEVCKKKPEKIYILLGTNALASGSNSAFILYYDKLIEMLQEQFPDAVIYIEGIPPVTAKVSTERITLSNGRIRKINVKIAKMATERGCYYIDLYKALAGGDKCLPDDIAQEDGIHMNEAGCRKWIDYLLCHTAGDVKEES